MMQSVKRDLRVLGLTVLAAMGLLAFAAGGAQGNWLYLKNGVSQEFHVNEEGAASAHVPGILLVPGLNLEIICNTIQGKDLLLLALSSTGTGRVAFSECTSYTTAPSLKAQPNCNPINQPVEGGGEAKLVLHNGKNYVLIGPPKGSSVFGVLEFSELCALVETVEIAGSGVAECGHLQSGAFISLDCATHQVTHLVRQAPSALFPGDVIQFGENPATLDGIAAIGFSGQLAGVSGGGHI